MSKLVENLAEELVEKLKEDGKLDLSDNEKFQEFTDLLYEILDNGKETDERVNELGEKTDGVDKKADDLDKNINGLANSIYTYFHQQEAKENAKNENDGVNSGVWLKLKSIEVNQNRVLSIVEKLQGNITAQGSDIETVKKEVQKTTNTDDKAQTATAEIGTETTDDEKGSKHHVRTFQYLKSIRSAVSRSEMNLRRDNKRMERSIKDKIKSGFGKWWGRLKKILMVAAIFLFGGVIKRILGGILEMTEPMWRPFTDWFTKNFPKLSEGIQWVMHAVGQILDFALTLKGLYDKYSEDDDKKAAMDAAGTVATYTAVGARVAGMPGAAIGALAGSFAAQIKDINNFQEVKEKYDAARKEYETALENKNITALERQRLKMEMAELDYIYEQKAAKFTKRLDQYDSWSRAGMASAPIAGQMAAYKMNLNLNYLDPKYKETYESEKMRYERMQTNPELFDANGNYDLGALTGGTFSGFANNMTFSDANTESGSTPTIVSSQTFNTVEMNVQPTEVPLQK